MPPMVDVPLSTGRRVRHRFQGHPAALPHLQGRRTGDVGAIFPETMHTNTQEKQGREGDRGDPPL